MADDLKDAILDNAQGPAKAAGDAGSVEQHKLSVTAGEKVWLGPAEATAHGGADLRAAS